MSDLKAQLEAALKERDEAREERDHTLCDRDFIFKVLLRTEKERDEAQAELARLRGKLDATAKEVQP